MEPTIDRITIDNPSQLRLDFSDFVPLNIVDCREDTSLRMRYDANPTDVADFPGIILVSKLQWLVILTLYTHNKQCTN